jgi:hypothetical protein
MFRVPRRPVAALLLAGALLLPALPTLAAPPHRLPSTRFLASLWETVVHWSLWLTGPDRTSHQTKEGSYPDPWGQPSQPTAPGPEASPPGTDEGSYPDPWG